MAKSFSYKKSINTTLKVSGFLDADKLTIEDQDGNVRDITTLLKDFEGSEITLQIGVKVENELEEPQND